MRRFKWLQLISIALILSGCSYNPFSRDNHLTGKPVGALIGGTVGAGGAALAGASKPMVVLTGIGGAAFGYYLTTLHFVSEGVRQAGGEVFTQGDCATISIPAHRLFEENSATLLPEATPALTSAQKVLEAYPDNNIIISGNSSGFSTRKFEKRLTYRRAREVAAFFWAHGLVTTQSNDNVGEHCQNKPLIKNRMLIIGNGAHFPIANNIEAKGIRANSQIQISTCPAPADFIPESSMPDSMTENVGRINRGHIARAKSTGNDFRIDEIPAPPSSLSGEFYPVRQKGDYKGTSYKN